MKPVIQPFSRVSTGLIPTTGSDRDFALGVLTASCGVQNSVEWCYWVLVGAGCFG